ncbi:hypothetical protein MY11210_005815 [Beauveria gryllotalpidicola]
MSSRQWKEFIDLLQDMIVYELKDRLLAVYVIRYLGIAFTDPIGSGDGPRRSIGCITSPFVTGVNASNKDTGDGFHVRQIEQNPSMFFSDVHSSLAVPGAFRGQLDEKKSC